MKYHDKNPVTHKAAVMFSGADGSVNLLREDVCLPAVAVKRSSLESNIAWMQRYADTRGVSLAPHGKTTMTPWIFQRQLAQGAWAIGVGSAWQAKVAMEAGLPRVLMANQLVGKANMQLISELKEQHPAATFYCCVDSLSNALALDAFFSGRGQTLDILLELGVPGGRCGCRSVAEASTLAEDISALPSLRLRGVELYEGVMHGDDAKAKIEQFLREAAGLLRELHQQQRFGNEEMILTGAGSSWYDVVCDVWGSESLPAHCRVVIRPGCYITHDQGIYQEAQNAILARDRYACDLAGELTSALELVALVQSVPEPGRIVVNFGKRDAAFDAGLPQPIAHYRDGLPQQEGIRGLTTIGIMDQHAMLTCPPDSSVQVGDILVFATSHPCLTFDKWKTLWLIDDDYNVVEALDTAF
ncbi:D-serine dehydratase [Serratia fonticola]|uniref:D-serine dehydratase n=1 Tax=Serratia fonticola TaxID=47917 RepID=A0A542BIY1_SERFO|nr:amino acid deaminase [Serratia fonticola]TQI78536.1 D-serine dehydratase [Serratia fonticola]TQI99441.1 D-serine dehydratase [Serratia fonticola]TVZ68965.1 D-serine dehydratase [Serratia fonticola]